LGSNLQKPSTGYSKKTPRPRKPPAKPINRSPAGHDRLVNLLGGFSERFRGKGLTSSIVAISGYKPFRIQRNGVFRRSRLNQKPERSPPERPG
jgi:hypothetical protein